MTIYAVSMMPGRQTQKIIVRIHHIYEKKVKSVFTLKIRSRKDGLLPVNYDFEFLEFIPKASHSQITAVGLELSELLVHDS